MPSVRDARMVGTRSKVVLVVAPLLCNPLPLEACLAPFLSAFRRQIKTELFKRAFIVNFRRVYLMNFHSFQWLCCDFTVVVMDVYIV